MTVEKINTPTTTDNEKYPIRTKGMAVVKLLSPLSIDGKECVLMTIREPMAGDLRGIGLGQLSTLDTETLVQLIPRITVTPVIPLEVSQNLTLGNLTAIGTAILGFMQ